LPLPKALEHEVSLALTQEIRKIDEPHAFRVEFSCSPIAVQPLAVEGLEVFGHAGIASVVGVQQTNAEGRAVKRTIRVKLGSAGAQSRVEFSREEIEASRAGRALDSVRAALAARIHEVSPPSSDGTGSESMTMSTSLLLRELYMSDARGGHAERAYAGYVGSFRAFERVPVAVAWRALAAMAPSEAPPETVEEADRQLLQRVWQRTSARPWYAEQALLGMAAVAGSPDLIDRIVPALGSDLPRTQELAVSALAAITGWDARIDVDGRDRPLSDVVRDYRRECSPP
jgi:hypothetical protein